MRCRGCRTFNGSMITLVLCGICALSASSAPPVMMFKNKGHEATIQLVNQNLELQSPSTGCTMIDGVCLGGLALKLDELIQVNQGNGAVLRELVTLQRGAVTHTANEKSKEARSLTGAKGSMDTAPWTLTISPAVTYTGGGEMLTITGKNFRNADYVWFGTEKQQTIHVVSDTTLTLRAPLHDAGEVDVTVGGGKGYFRTLRGGITFSPKSTGPPDVRFATSSKSP